MELNGAVNRTVSAQQATNGGNKFCEMPVYPAALLQDVLHFQALNP